MSQDLLGLVKGATDGQGVDVVFDAAGIQASIDAALACVRPKGTIANVAIWEKDAQVNMNAILTKEIYLTGTLLVRATILKEAIVLTLSLIRIRHVGIRPCTCRCTASHQVRRFDRVGSADYEPY